MQSFSGFRIRNHLSGLARLVLLCMIWVGLDLLFGCILDWGLPLSLPYTSEEIDGCTIHDYNEGDLIACFDKNIPKSVIEVIAKKKPLRAVFRDSSFEADDDRINVEEIFKLYAPDTRVKVI